MIIQARQAFEIKDKVLGILSLRYNEIRTGVDEKWKGNSFFSALMSDGLIVYYEDDKSKTVETANKKAADKQEAKIEKTELDRLIDEAKAKAKRDAEEVATTQGFDKMKADKLLKTYTEKAISEAKETYEKSKKVKE